MSLDQNKIEELIRDKTKSPEEIIAELTAMIEEAHPLPAFEDGETLLLHEFEARFKAHYCRGNVTHFYQWPVRVSVDQRGNVTLHLGRTLEERKKELADE